MAVEGFITDEDNDDLSASLLVSFFVAFFRRSIHLECWFLRCTAGSAIRTVIVCFAEGTEEFEDHHPELSEVTKSEWDRDVPDCR